MNSSPFYFELHVDLGLALVRGNKQMFAFCAHIQTCTGELSLALGKGHWDSELGPWVSKGMRDG